MRRDQFEKVQHIQDPIYPWFEGEPKLEDGVLYVVDGPRYIEYNCPCGCGNTVMIPFQRAGETENRRCGGCGWDMTETDGKVTLSPSVFSSGWPCRSHYFIRGSPH